MVLKSIGVMSVGKVSAALYAVFGFIAGLLFAVGSFFAMLFGDGGFGGFIAGLASIIGFPLMYGVLGFLGGALSALVYNFVAGIAGGIELEME